MEKDTFVIILLDVKKEFHKIQHAILFLKKTFKTMKQMETSYKLMFPNKKLNGEQTLVPSGQKP